MIKSESFKGIFFLPEDITNEIAGELTFDFEGSIKLELFGSLFKTTDDLLNKHQSGVIWGHTFEGANITLFDCEVISSRSNNDFITTTILTVVYNVRVIVNGIHSRNLNDPNYKVMDVRLDYLTDWAQAPYAKIAHSDNKLIISQEQPENICFDITSNIRGEIVFSHSLPNNNSIDLRVNCHLSLQSKNGVSLLEFRSALQKIQSMLSLFTLNKVRILHISLYSPNEFKIIRDNINIPTHIKVLYLQPYTKYIDAHPYNFLIAYTNIATIFDDVVTKWFDINEELAPILNILRNHLGEYTDFNESHFLSIIQAVEAFHRRKIQNTNELKRLDKLWKLDILKEVKSDEAMKWLKGKLAFSYEPSLKERLKENFKAHAAILFKNNHNESDIERLIKHIVNTRNYYTHYGSDLEHKKLKLNSMHQATLLLRTLLIIQVLYAIAIPYDIIDKAIKPSMRFTVPTN